jgi:hypothetical protein
MTKVKARIITHEPGVCEFKKEGYCRASDTQNPVIFCEYANYNASSYYPPCSK